MRRKKKLFYENTTRSISKAVTYRTLILLSDSLIIYFITHRFDIALSVMFFSNFASTVLYFLHERAWNHIHIGKRGK